MNMRYPTIVFLISERIGVEENNKRKEREKVGWEIELA